MNQMKYIFHYDCHSGKGTPPVLIQPGRHKATSEEGGENDIFNWWVAWRSQRFRSQVLLDV